MSDQSIRFLNLPDNSPLLARFWSKVAVGGPDECWDWTGAHASTGYGSMGVMRKGEKWGVSAHRVAWVLRYGRVPDGLFVCHRCDNRSCVNPDHLFLGTPKDNQRDMMQKGRGNKVVGVRSPTAKLNPEKVREIRRRSDAGVPRKELAAQFGITMRTVDSVRYRDTWDEVL